MENPIESLQSCGRFVTKFIEFVLESFKQIFGMFIEKIEKIAETNSNVMRNKRKKKQAQIVDNPFPPSDRTAFNLFHSVHFERKFIEFHLRAVRGRDRARQRERQRKRDISYIDELKQKKNTYVNTDSLFIGKHK